MKRLFKDNGLSLVLIAFFLIFWSGQAVCGFHERNADERQHGRPPVPFVDYLRSAHFLEATFENWESEFLQMAAYVILTVFLYQRGSAESKDPDEKEAVDDDVKKKKTHPSAPRAVRAGGWRLKIYSHSLSLALCSLFLGCWLGHAWAGASQYSTEQLEHGQPPISLLEYLGTSRFWFESFQNWQSEFVAVAAIVVLSIWLREKGSPESKPLAAPHSSTGS